MDVLTPPSRYQVLECSFSFTLLRAHAQKEKSVGLLLYAESRIEDIRRSGIRVFSSLPIQNLTGYLDGPVSTLCYLCLQPSANCNGKVALWQHGFVDLLEGTGLDFAPYPFALPFGPMSVALSSSVIAFPARPSGSFNPGESTSTLYTIAISSVTQSTRPLKPIEVGRHTGQCLHPAFSPSGRSLAFTKGESSLNPTGDKKLYITNLPSDHAHEIVLEKDGHPHYMEIESILWSHDERSLFMCSTYYGTTTLVRVDLQGDCGVPKTLFDNCSVSSVHRLPRDRLLLNTSSFVCPSEYLIYDLEGSQRQSLGKVDLKDFSVGDHQISGFYYKGHSNDEVQAWVVKPSFFNPQQKYPLALFIHGGPMWPETNSWLARWNALLIAEHGYIVVSPNFGGTPGSSSHFKQKVLGHFGDIPYHDLELCMDHVADNLEYVDMSRATALGGSFGGFMAFWIAGHPLAKRFRALVSHAGIFNGPSLAGTDVPDAWRLLYAGLDRNQDLIGSLEEFDPARYSYKWQTPMLISVGEKDRRIPPSNALGAFSALQFRGIESKLLIFPDEGHMILKPANSLRWYEMVIDWINAHTGVSQAI